MLCFFMKRSVCWPTLKTFWYTLNKRTIEIQHRTKITSQQLHSYKFLTNKNGNTPRLVQEFHSTLFCYITMNEPNAIPRKFITHVPTLFQSIYIHTIA